MTRFVALLRGVNVGGVKRVPMADLCALLESMGLGGVRTLLNSGNAVFDSTARSCQTLATRIEAGIDAALGLRVPVVVKSARAFAAIEAGNPFAAQCTDASRLLVAMTRDAAGLAELEAVVPWARPPEGCHLGEHALYLWCPEGILASAAAKALLGPHGAVATTRNWATVQKIGALLKPAAD